MVDARSMICFIWLVSRRLSEGSPLVGLLVIIRLISKHISIDILYTKQKIIDSPWNLTRALDS